MKKQTTPKPKAPKAATAKTVSKSAAKTAPAKRSAQRKQSLSAMSAADADKYVGKYFRMTLEGTRTNGRIISVKGLDDQPKTMEVILKRGILWESKNRHLTEKEMNSIEIIG